MSERHVSTSQKNEHTCHAHGCSKPVPPKMFMCRAHWFSLRPALRSAIWREYRPGQERDKQPSARYMAVQRRAIAELIFKPNDEAAARAAANCQCKVQRLGPCPAAVQAAYELGRGPTN